MSYRRAEENVLKFLSYLQDKGELKKNEINKELARTIFINEFKSKYEISKFSFSSMFSYLRYFGLITYNKNTKTITVKSDILNHITQNVNIVKRKSFKIAPLLQKQQNSTVVPNMNDEESKKRRPSNTKNTKKVIKQECKVCSLLFENANLLKRHKTTQLHKLRINYITKKKNSTNPAPALIPEVVAGHGAGTETITVHIDESCLVTLIIKNTSSTNYTIQEVIELNHSIFISILYPGLPITLSANTNCNFHVKVLFKEALYWSYPLILKVKDLDATTEFELMKELVFSVHSPILDDLKAIEPYIKKVSKAIPVHGAEDIIRGELTQKTLYDFVPKFPLLPYKLNDNIVLLLNARLREFEGITRQQYNMLTDIKIMLSDFNKINTLDSRNYFRLLQLLLFMEEHQMQINIQKYSVDNQLLLPAKGFRNNFLELPVPGLAEHRPSILRGDSVFVKENVDSKTKYEGIVHKVQQSSVILAFNRKFSTSVHVNNKKYSVSFTFNRVTLRAEHQAIDLARKHNIIQTLFCEKIKPISLKYKQIKWYNSDIRNNEMQQQAILHILSETSRPLPYLIFGPPGTGKTVTVVEAIHQIWKLQSEKKVLVCAPSNSAANEITKRLIKYVPKHDLLRYVALSYPYDQIDEVIKPFANYNKNQEFYHPTLQALQTYRILVTTVVNAVRLVNVGLPTGHFSYVFIDESGQATETETLIPIAGILSNAETHSAINGQIILAGDPKQLGPIIHSTEASRHGFGISMLERLMTFIPLYEKNTSGDYNKAVLTKLVQSYRSHAAIIKLPNNLFYDDELVAAADKKLTTIAEGWSELPNAKFPIIFHSVLGKDEQEANSPSFFNLQEIDVVLSYLDKLIGNRLSGMAIKQEHIGIIAPYQRQVQKLKNVCAKKYWMQLSIGSVEQFQGQERLIIIVSTVRSKPQIMEHDEKFHLGFLKNPKRFNVALTRAKALLIVIGNPNILQYDRYWYELIKYCKDNDSCLGSSFELTNRQFDETSASSGPVSCVLDGPNFSRCNL